MNILVVEDERGLADAIAHVVGGAGYNVEVAYDGNAADAFLRRGGYDAVVMDVMLPGMDGFEIVHAMRGRGDRTPVLMLTARTATSDKVEGLDSGADDYMTKPFDNDELLARLRALTRRTGEVIMDSVSFEDVTLDIASHDLSCGERRMHLSEREFDVMLYLMSHPRQVVPKQDILAHVWGTAGDDVDNSVEDYVSFLRKKLRHIGSDAQIETLRMLGYRLDYYHLD